MTYNTNVPNPNQSPGRLPAQASVNWTRLKDIIQANHLFTDTASTTEGFHQIVEWVKQASTPAANANGAQTWVEDADYRTDNTDYTSPHLFHRPTSGTGADPRVFPLSVLPVRAAVNFNGTGANGSKTIRSSYNIDSVTRTAEGRYTVTITTGAIPSANYFPLVIGMADNNVEIMPYIVGSGTVTNSMTATTLRIAFRNAGGGSGGFEDVVMGSVVIIGG